MPIEIKELVIRATIDSDKESGRQTNVSEENRKENRRVNDLHLMMEQLSDMIKQKNER